MDSTGSFDDVMTRLQAGDPRAAALVFERFAQRLMALARARLDGRTRQKLDPEDVLQSVFRSFFARQAAGQFHFEGWEGLWGMLVLLTVRKCGRKAQQFRRDRRDVHREMALPDNPDGAATWEALAREPTPEEAAVFADLVERLVGQSSELERPILELCLQGYTQVEISAQVGCTERTVRRVLTRLRQRLQQLNEPEVIGPRKSS
jgi:RNA polymerase sigma factor (sigma-70 family)